MPRNILIIDGHPDAIRPHLSAAFADAYAEGAMAAGHAIRRIVVAQLDFPWLRSQQEFESRQLPPSLTEAAANLAWADHIVIVFPLWLGTMPALLKAFLEQVIRPGIVFEYGSGGSWNTMLLKGRSARLIVTMGMPSILYRLWFLSHGVATLRRGILNFVGIRPVRESFFGMIDQADERRKTRWLATLRALGRRAA
jgi:putative NADPH-quinone reductase